MRFLEVTDGFLLPPPTPPPPPPPPPNMDLPIGLLFSTVIAECLVDGLAGMSNGPELELLCLVVCGHISSRGPEVSGVKTEPSAAYN